MNIINLGEVYYRVAQLRGVADADDRLRLFRKLPIEIVQVKETLVIEAARLKAVYPLSYADAFAVATARAERAAVLTGDPEIIALPKSVIKVIKLERASRWRSS